MARTTKALSGGAKDKMLRGIVRSAGGVPDDVARRVETALIESVSEVRVRREAWEALRGQAGHSAAALRAPARAAPASPEAALPVAPAAGTEPGAAQAAGAFDPFAFSAVALLTRKGKAALAAEFERIGGVDQLREIARAQHLAVDPTLEDAAALRAAMVAATERRIAERKAAAS